MVSDLYPFESSPPEPKRPSLSSVGDCDIGVWWKEHFEFALAGRCRERESEERWASIFYHAIRKTYLVGSRNDMCQLCRKVIKFPEYRCPPNAMRKRDRRSQPVHPNRHFQRETSNKWLSALTILLKRTWQSMSLHLLNTRHLPTLLLPFRYCKIHISMYIETHDHLPERLLQGDWL
jgi:hypothetical protein